MVRNKVLGAAAVLVMLGALAGVAGVLAQQSTPTQPMGPGLILRPAFAIAGLPTCNSSTAGANAYVTNGVASPTFMGAVSTTGAATDPVFCTGSGWVYD